MMPAARFIVALLVAAAALAAGTSAQPQSDLNVFMQQVLARRDDNWRKLQQYVLDEREELELRGPGGLVLWGEKREYTWYVRDGFFVRSPVAFNGATIGEADRRKYEDDYLRRQQRREQTKTETANATPQNLNEFITQTRDPQFISSAYFLRLRFEDGRYALVGRETVEGRETLRIEYYPSALFRPSQREIERNRNRRSVEVANEMATRTLMNEGSLVTLWVDPDRHQILKYTFDNFAADLVPQQWLGRLRDMHATMRMAEAFPDVWLPRDIDMHLGLSLAVGEFDFRYGLEYHDYRKADVSTTIRIPER